MKRETMWKGDIAGIVGIVGFAAAQSLIQIYIFAVFLGNLYNWLQ